MPKNSNHASRISLRVLAEQLQAELVGGDGDLEIESLAPLNAAHSGQLSFLASSRFVSALSSTGASAVILSEQYTDHCPCAALVVSDPYAAYARASQFFTPAADAHQGRHPSAWISDAADVHGDVSLGPNAVVEAGVRVGQGVRIGANCYLGADVQVGAHSQLYPGVNIYRDCQIGQRCIIHSGVTIGADGFGFARTSAGYEKIAQLARVVIGNDVEIGANATADRGALQDTVLEDGVKVDSQVHIGHGVQVGRHTVIAACAALGGSAKVGAWCQIGGLGGIAPGICIADGVIISPTTLVLGDITEEDVIHHGVRYSGVGAMPHRQWIKQVVASKRSAHPEK